MSKPNFIRKASVFHLFCCVLLINGESQDDKYSEEAGREYLKKINRDIQVKTTESVLASWAYESNITDENLRNQLEVSAKLANFTKEIWKETIKFPWMTFQDPDIRRQFQKFSVLGTAILSPEKYEKFNKIISDMQSVYGKAKICYYRNRTDCSLQLEPELTEIFMKSRDPDELRYYWEQWRITSGRPVRQMFKEYVDLANEAAVLNNFTNNAEFWLKDYEAPDFKEQVETLWEQLRPLYLQLHAYVRRRLREQYGEKHVTKRGPIPAHLLGNMWAQSWGNIFDFTAPYPSKPSTDVTPNMVEQGYTPLRMFKLAEQFFTSLNLSPMPDTFWKNSILEKPNDGRDLICHASAWDFYDGKDFRIKQCTRVTFRQLVTVHHEMGHVQYYLQYKNKPKIYRRGANPGFHEAVGDVMALSVSTPKHLRKIGLLNAVEDDAESEINQLFTVALDKIAFLPFGYLMDQWRWGVFEGKITEKDYNCKWWQLREKYQGLSPSVVRSEADFDPGAKYHTVGSVPYIRYFVSFVIQFQFHRSLCIAAKEYDPDNPASKPLHKCDIYQSKEAGALLKEMLQMGSSKPWPDAMEVMTGQRKMDARALLEYFASLQDWLEKENARTNEYIGWDCSQKVCGQEDDSEGVTPSMTAQRNFEDDNVAYSYAEFVRQDDNAFGVPDYLEESEPSYFALPHRPQGYGLKRNLNLAGKNIENLHENKNIYLSDDSELENKNEYDVRAHPHDKLDRLKKPKPCEMFENGRYTNCRNQLSAWPNTVFDLGTKEQEIERSKIKEALEKMNNRQNEQRLKKLDVGLQPLDKEQLMNLIKISTAKNSETNPSGEGEEILGDKPENGDEKLQAALPLMNPKENLQKNEINYYLQAGINNEEAEDNSGGNNKYVISENNILDQPNFLETLNKYGKLNLKPNNELIRKAELVKNQAVDMLKNYNLTNPLPLLQDDRIGQKGSKDHSFDFNLPVKLSKSNLNEMERVDTTRTLMRQNIQNDDLGEKINLFENLPKKSLWEYGERSSDVEKPFKEFNSGSVISTRLLRKKLQNLQDEQRNVQRKNEEIRNDYGSLIGKLLTNDELNDGKRQLQKKSYREFSSRVKTPVVYNAVVITDSGKGEKNDDAKEQWLRANYGPTGAVERQGNLQPLERFKKESDQISQTKRDIRRNILRSRLYEPVYGYKYKD